MQQEGKLTMQSPPRKSGITSLSCMRLCIASRQICSMIIPGTGEKLAGYSFFPFLKAVCDASVGTSPYRQDCLNMMESAYISEDSEMRVIWSHRLGYIQSHMVVLNLLCLYSGVEFAPPVPTKRFKDVRNMRIVARRIVKGFLISN